MAEAMLLREVQDVAEPLHVRPHVLGVLLAREVVMRREVDDRIGAPVGGDLGKDGFQAGPIPDVDLGPRDIRVPWGAASGLASPGNPEDSEVFLKRGQQVPTDEAGGAGDDEAGKGHQNGNTPRSGSRP